MVDWVYVTEGKILPKQEKIAENMMNCNSVFWCTVCCCFEGKTQRSGSWNFLLFWLDRLKETGLDF